MAAGQVRVGLLIFDAKQASEPVSQHGRSEYRSERYAWDRFGRIVEGQSSTTLASLELGSSESRGSFPIQSRQEPLVAVYCTLERISLAGCSSFVQTSLSGPVQ